MRPCLESRRHETSSVGPVLNREVLWPRHGCSAEKLNALRAMPGWNTPPGYTKCVISGPEMNSSRDRLFTVFERTGAAGLAESAMPRCFDIWKENHCCA